MVMLTLELSLAGCTRMITQRCNIAVLAVPLNHVHFTHLPHPPTLPLLLPTLPLLLPTLPLLLSTLPLLLPTLPLLLPTLPLLLPSLPLLIPTPLVLPPRSHILYKGCLAISIVTTDNNTPWTGLKHLVQRQLDTSVYVVPLRH